MRGVVLCGGVGVGGGVRDAGVAADDVVLGDRPVIAPGEVGEFRPAADIAVDARARSSLFIDTVAVLKDKVRVPAAPEIGDLDVGAGDCGAELAGLGVEIPAVGLAAAVHCGDGHDAGSIEDVLRPLRRMQDLQALAPLVPLVEVRAPQLHFAYAGTVGIEYIGLLGAVAPAAFFALVRNLLVHADREVAPDDDRAGRSVLDDAHAGEIGVLVAHRLRAAPAGHLLALDEFVAHPVALFRHKARRVGNPLPENDLPRLLRAEADNDIVERAPPAVIEGLVEFQRHVPRSEGEGIRPGRKYACFKTGHFGPRRRGTDEFFLQDSLPGILVIVDTEFVNGSVEAAVDGNILILEEGRGPDLRAANPEVVVRLLHGRELERLLRHLPAVDGEEQPAAGTERGRKP